MNINSLQIESRLREDEALTLKLINNNFETINLSTQQKLENFTNWVRHRDIARLLYKADLMKSILHVPGSIIECGVLYGGGLSTWIHLSEIYEPVNYGRRIIGIDTFSGFPEVTEQDQPKTVTYPDLYRKGTYSSENQSEDLFDLFKLIDKTRKIPQLPKVELLKGDVTTVLPDLLDSDKSLLISCLYLDLDLYAPTLASIQSAITRMPKGSIICIDELCYKDWPGETQAVLDFFNLNTTHIERSPIVPNIATIRL